MPAEFLWGKEMPAQALSTQNYSSKRRARARPITQGVGLVPLPCLAPTQVDAIKF
jgi:hypothetical protein